MPIDFSPSLRNSLSYMFINLLFTLNSCHSYNMHQVVSRLKQNPCSTEHVGKQHPACMAKENYILSYKTFRLLCLKALVNLTKEEILICRRNVNQCVGRYVYRHT